MSQLSGMLELRVVFEIGESILPTRMAAGIPEQVSSDLLPDCGERRADANGLSAG